MLSTTAIAISRSGPFQARCQFFALKAAFAYASAANPTANQLRFAKAAVVGTLDLQRLAMSVLATANFGEVDDNDGTPINDAALENVLNSITENTGKALA